MYSHNRISQHILRYEYTVNVRKLDCSIVNDRFYYGDNLLLFSVAFTKLNVIGL